MQRGACIKPLFAAFLMLLAACSSPPDPSVTALHTPPKDAARIVLLYPAPIMGSNGMIQVKWNDKTACDLGSGTFIARDIPAATEALAFSFCGVRGTSAFSVKVEAGHTYYFRVLPYDSSVRGKLSGYPSEYDDKMEGVIAKKGPIEVERIEEDKAFEELQSLAPAAHS